MVPGGPETTGELRSNWKRSQPSQDLQEGPFRHRNRKGGTPRQEELGRKTFIVEASECQGGNRARCPRVRT